MERGYSIPWHCLLTIPLSAESKESRRATSSTARRSRLVLRPSRLMERATLGSQEPNPKRCSRLCRIRCSPCGTGQTARSAKRLVGIGASAGEDVHWCSVASRSLQNAALVTGWSIPRRLTATLQGYDAAFRFESFQGNTGPLCIRQAPSSLLASRNNGLAAASASSHGTATTSKRKLKEKQPYL
jgi:hypothetical protein